MSWNPEQRLAIETTGTDLCVDAAAGSGKTTVLIERLAELLGRHQVPLESIVAITFTDAAAAEMRERLRRKCREMESTEDREVMNHWRHIARRVDTARISTIHAFCAALLREQALSLELDPDFTLMTEAEAMLLRQETVRNAIHCLLLAEDANSQFVIERLGVSSLEQHIARLLADRLAGEALYAFNGANDGDGLLALWRQTVHAAWLGHMKLASRRQTARMLRRQLDEFDGLCDNPDDGREQLRQEMVSAFNTLDTADSEEAYAQALNRLTGGLNGRRGSSKNWPGGMMSTLTKVQDAVKRWGENHMLPSMAPDLERDAAELTLAVVAVYRNVSDAYQSAKRMQSALDFDDLIIMVRDVLRDREDVRNRVARGIRHLLVDEFQDTDSIQYEIISLLGKANPKLEIFIVGDAKQSIYGFRGAEVDVFQQAHENREIIHLDQNYRTTPSLLAFVNDFFARTDLLAAVEPTYHPMRPHRSEVGEPSVEFLVPEIEEEKPKAEAQRLHQGALIASRIASFCDPDNPFLVGDEQRPAQFGDVAILLRAFSNVHLFERGLREQGIPYQVVAGRGFYKQQEIIDMANLLRVVVDPQDELSLLGFLRGPMAGLSDETLIQLCEHGSLLEAFHGGAACAELDHAQQLILDLKAHVALPLGSFMRYALGRTAIEAILLPQFRGTQRAANVRKLVDLADDFARSRPPRLTDFVQYVGMVSDGDIREGEASLDVEDANAVTIMTIHNAKGLEFPIVVLGDLGAKHQGDRHSPSILVDRELGPATKIDDEYGEFQDSPMVTMIKRLEAAQEEAERFRLLYVAMTRARDRLILGMGTNADRNSWQGLFDAEWPIGSAKHGEMIKGTDWKGQVFREACHRELVYQQKDKPSESLDTNRLFEQVTPIPRTASTRNRFAAGTLAALMAELPPPTDDDGERDSPLLPGVDPITRGSALHRLLEEWNLDEDLGSLIEGILREECDSIEAARLLRPYLHARAEAFRDSAIGQRMVSNARCIREQPFVLRFDQSLIAGTIDLVFEDGSVVDYKTGHHAPWKQDRYAWQVRIYALAQKVLHGKDAPRGFVYYLDFDECHEVDVSALILDETQRRLEQTIARLRSDPELRAAAGNDTDVA